MKRCRDRDRQKKGRLKKSEEDDETMHVEEVSDFVDAKRATVGCYRARTR